MENVNDIKKLAVSRARVYAIPIHETFSSSLSYCEYYSDLRSSYDRYIILIAK